MFRANTLICILMTFALNSYGGENPCKDRYDISPKKVTLPNGNVVEQFSNVETSKFIDIVKVLKSDSRMGPMIDGVLAVLENQNYKLTGANLSCLDCNETDVITTYRLTGRFVKDGVAMQPEIRFTCLEFSPDDLSPMNVSVNYKLLVGF